MARIYLVRHGEASATWIESHDPGLSEKGHDQAKAVAERFAAGPQMALITSPLMRARETAAPLAKLWGVTPHVDESFAEIPTPDGVNLAERGPWLRTFMGGQWRQAPQSLQAWRNRVVDGLLAQTTDTIVFSHYIAINVAAGAATGRDAVVCFSPAHCSVSVVEVSGGALLLSALGAQMALPV